MIVLMMKKFITVAAASYGKFVKPHCQNDNISFSNEDLKKNLEEDPLNFIEIEADTFVNNYEIVHQQENIDFNGFSAALFKDKETDKHIIAMRGTDQLVDGLSADVYGIGVNGFAYAQAVEMYRYYKKLTTEAGEPVQYSEQEKWQLFQPFRIV